MTTTLAGNTSVPGLHSVQVTGEPAGVPLHPSSESTPSGAGGERPRDLLSPVEIFYCAKSLAALSSALMITDDQAKEIAAILTIQLRAVVTHPDQIEKMPTGTPETPAIASMVTGTPVLELPNQVPRTALDYDTFAHMFEKFGRRPTDAMNRWFRDVGGFDAATEEQRNDIYRKANQYYSNNPTPQPKSSTPPEKCPECGSPTGQKQGKFGPFTGCTNYPTCKWIFKKARA